MSMRSNKYVLLTAVANIFFLLTASSFQRWLPKAFSPLFRLCVGQINSRIVVIKNTKQGKTKQKIPISPTVLKRPTGTHPTEWPETKQFCSKPGRLGKPCRSAHSYLYHGELQRNMQTGKPGTFHCLTTICFIVLSLSSLPRASSTEVAGGSPDTAVSMSLTTSGIAFFAKRHHDRLPISRDELIMQVDEIINISASKHVSPSRAT